MFLVISDQQIFLVISDQTNIHRVSTSMKCHSWSLDTPTIFVKYWQSTQCDCFRALGILTVPLLALQWPRWDHLQVKACSFVSDCLSKSTKIQIQRRQYLTFLIDQLASSLPWFFLSVGFLPSLTWLFSWLALFLHSSSSFSSSPLDWSQNHPGWPIKKKESPRSNFTWGNTETNV